VFALIKNNKAVAFPYSRLDLKKDNPGTLFPSPLTEEFLSEFGVVRVHEANPDLDVDPLFQTIETDAMPTFDGSRWVIGRRAVNLSEEQAALACRSQRNRLLAESDWTQVLDSPVDKDAWASYRQGLRDITLHAKFPYVPKSDWPQKPA
jgi:hypothetical protein